MNQLDIESLFAELLPLIDAQITKRIITFHEALVERGQIAPTPPLHGTTVDCTADQVRVADRSR